MKKRSVALTLVIASAQARRQGAGQRGRAVDILGEVAHLNGLVPLEAVRAVEQPGVTGVTLDERGAVPRIGEEAILEGSALGWEMERGGKELR